MSIADLWTRLETFAQGHGRSLMLRDGVSGNAIDAAEKRLGRAFPDDVRSSLLLHDGQENDIEAFQALPGAGLLAPLDVILEQHLEVAGLAREFREEDDYEGDGYDDRGMSHWDLFHQERIPLGGYPHFDGDASYVDFAVGPNGTPGQIIALVTESDFACLGSSFEATLRMYVELLESGEWVYSAKDAGVFPKNRRAGEFPNLATLLAERTS